MKILLLQDMDELRERVHFALESSYGATVEVRNIPDAAAAIEKATSLDVIIYDVQQADPQSFKDFLAAVPATPIILCAQGGTVSEEIISSRPNIVGVVDRGNIIQSITALVDKLIGQGTLPKPNLEDQYVRIRTKLLLSVCPLKSDIYIRLGEWKFVKLFHQGDKFEKDDMEKYTIKKGVEYLYLRRDSCQEFIEKYSKDLQKLLASKPEGLQAVAQQAEVAHETVRQLGQRLGFTREVQDLVKSQIAVTLKSVGKSPQLGTLIEQLKARKGEYIASHSTMCAYLACAIASQMKWGSDMTFHKLNLAAFLHDITLQNNELAACHTLAELDKVPGKFTAAEIKAFRDHPILAAEVARNFSEVPPDVDNIILQHHEHPEGTGFPRKLIHSRISPLSALFIVAHDLTVYTLEKGPYFQMKEFLKVANSRYKASQFKKVLQAMEKL